MMDRQDEARARFEAEQGEWDDRWAGLLAADPGFFAAFSDLAGVPWRTGVLEPKFKEMVQLAVAGAATHLDEAGVRRHVRRAIALGATRDELTEVLELTATLGIHASNVGVPTMMDAFRDAGRELSEGPLSERQAQLRAAFEEQRGYWHDFWDDLLRLDADFFEAYLNFSSHPWRHGSLGPKEKELIYIAFDASATHMFLPGLRLHIDNAIGYGATPGEIVEVFELASTIGIKTLRLGLPILDEEFAAASGDAD